MHLLARLASEHQKTILFSSHDLDLIVRTADNVWLIGNGAPIVQGVPEMLLKNNSFSQSFGNNRLQYDTLLGQFQLNHNARGTYKVSNEVADSPLVRNALQRRGFMPSSDNQADVLIEMVEENIVVRLNGEIFTFENFEQLIYGIQKL
jgi:iron complex transport system ATP-binding protein